MKFDKESKSDFFLEGAGGGGGRGGEGGWRMALCMLYKQYARLPKAGWLVVLDLTAL